MATANDNSIVPTKKKAHPFRTAVLRGLGVVSPPLFTILIFVWVASMTYRYIVEPVTNLARESIVVARGDVKTATELGVSDPNKQMVEYDGEKYQRVDENNFVFKGVYDAVVKNPNIARPKTAMDFSRAYVDMTALQPYRIIPLVLAVFILILYLLGKFMAAGIGRMSWNLFEQGVHRLPLIRNVYSSVKQVSDFLFTEREIEYTRVIAVEYPRKGIWSLGLVTGESMLDIRSAANEPVLSVLMPTSPMPVTGFTVTVRKSETIDLNITIDQAFQFIISCGVVVPAQQLQTVQNMEAAALPAPGDDGRSADTVDSGGPSEPVASEK